jgi:hypothetical protein
MCAMMLFYSLKSQNLPGYMPVNNEQSSSNFCLQIFARTLVWNIQFHTKYHSLPFFGLEAIQYSFTLKLLALAELRLQLTLSYYLSLEDEMFTSNWFCCGQVFSSSSELQSTLFMLDRFPQCWFTYSFCVA